MSPPGPWPAVSKRLYATTAFLVRDDDIRGGGTGSGRNSGEQWSGGRSGWLVTGSEQAHGGEGRLEIVDTHGIRPHRYGTFLIDTFLRGCQERVKRGYCAGATSPAANTLRSSVFPSIVWSSPTSESRTVLRTTRTFRPRMLFAIVLSVT